MALVMISAENPLRSYVWVVLRVAAVIAFCAFIIDRVPSRIERDQLAEHNIIMQMDETGVLVGIELTQDSLYEGVAGDIAAQNSIRSVRLKNLHCTDELLSAIAELPLLRSFTCEGCTITDEQLDRLKHVRLQYIDLSETVGLNKGLNLLANQNQLLGISLHGCEWLSDADLQLLSSFPQLQSIDLSGCRQLNSVSLLPLERCASMTRLVMRDVPLKLGTVAAFRKVRPNVTLTYDEPLAPDLLPLLQQDAKAGEQTKLPYAMGQSGSRNIISDLHAYVNTTTDVSILQYLPHLISLKLTGPGVDDSVVQYIAEMKNLSVLDLSQSRISDAAFGMLPAFQRLNGVHLADTVVSEAVLRWLSRIPDLWSLGLSGATFTLDSGNAVQAFSNLETLNLNRTQFATTILARLDVPNLRTLRMEECGVTDAELNLLASFPRLSTLHLSGNPLDGRGLTALKDLPIYSLRLHRTQLNDSGLEKISCLQKLNVLDVSGTTISGTGFRTCSESSIDSLKLDDLTISRDGADAISQLMKLNNINLLRTVMPAESWQCFADRRQLTRVSMEGKSELLEPLVRSEASARLRTLILIDPDRNALRLIAQFHNLESIGLSDCNLDESAAEMIICSPGCSTLFLHHCTISMEAIQILASSEILSRISIFTVEAESPQIDTEALKLINPNLLISVYDSPNSHITHEWMFWIE